MYSLSDREKQLGLGEKGITKYFSPNCDTADSDLVNKYLKAKNIEGQCQHWGSGSELCFVSVCYWYLKKKCLISTVPVHEK
jgi:hypothetical protein